MAAISAPPVHLLQVLAQVNKRYIVLASQSPRRKEILNTIGLNFATIPSTFPETLDKSKFDGAGGYVVENARQKALEVMSRLVHDSGERVPDLVIGSDTVVVGPEGVILEKPATAESAVTMLSGLAGKVHHVYSGVALVVPGGAEPVVAQAWHSVTEVHFAPASTAVLQAYVEMGESMDKAGGYGIQSAGALLVSRIVGDFNNVKGFPLYDFAAHLATLATEEWDMKPASTA